MLIKYIEVIIDINIKYIKIILKSYFSINMAKIKKYKIYNKKTILIL